MSNNFIPQNRKQWIIAAVLFLFLISICIVLASRLIAAFTAADPRAEKKVTVTELAYCHEEQIGPCVVSFGINANGNMLVNILLDDPTYPAFTLQILRENETVTYTCLPLEESPLNVPCLGQQMPPGEVLHLVLINVEDETILAKGDLSIIGLAFPTLGVVTPTAIPSPESTSTPLVSYP